MATLSSIDHLVIAGPDLAALSQWWADAVGQPAQEGGAHTGRGTRNELAGIDPTTYVELIAPDPEQPEPSRPRPFGIDHLPAHRLVTFAVAVSDIDVACDAVRSTGIDPGEPTAMERLRPDGVLLSWRLAVPPNPALAGVMPFLIDWGDTAHPAQDLAASVTLTELHLQHPDAARVAAAIQAATGETVAVNPGEPGLTAQLEGVEQPAFRVSASG